MTYEQFSQTLKRIGVSRKEFADLTGLRYHSITNWSHLEIPSWVGPFLSYYEKALKFDKLKQIISDNNSLEGV